MEEEHLEQEKPHPRHTPALAALGSRSTNRSGFSLMVKCHCLACPASEGNISCVSLRGKGLTEPERNAGGSGTGGGDREMKPGGTWAARTAPAQGSGRVRFTAPGDETWD